MLNCTYDQGFLQTIIIMYDSRCHHGTIGIKYSSKRAHVYTAKVLQKLPINQTHVYDLIKPYAEKNYQAQLASFITFEHFGWINHAFLC
mmetsp:Transcript_31807/g.47445  ORF Transcript_31807/g.47445 Transcript_31807/m.47445 type:complete len:89 (-) Transcript_31807:712-978(-)